MNTSHLPMTHKTHHLSAAVIQHLTDRIEELEHKLTCIMLNSNCYLRHSQVEVKHSLIRKFDKEHKKYTISESDIKEFIEMRLQNHTLNLGYGKGNSFLSKIPNFLTHGFNSLITSIIFIGLTIVILYFIIKLLVRLTRKRHNYLSISQPYSNA